MASSPEGIQWGRCVQGCVCSRGVRVWGCVSGCTPPGPRARHPPPMNGMANRCKNITFPQIRFQAVIKKNYPTRMHSSRMCTACGSSHQLGGVCLSTCWDTPHPQVWAWRPLPLGVGLERIEKLTLCVETASLVRKH